MLKGRSPSILHQSDIWSYIRTCVCMYIIYIYMYIHVCVHIYINVFVSRCWPAKISFGMRMCLGACGYFSSVRLKSLDTLGGSCCLVSIVTNAFDTSIGGHLPLPNKNGAFP